MSDLLNSASLVMIPSGYKEDVVYSQIPTDGSGDMAFTRASNGTRINSAGLVEDVPWNLLQYSEDFSNAYWTKVSSPVMAYNVATAPNGTMTADSIQSNSASVYQSVTATTLSVAPNSTVTLSIYIKKETTKTYFGGSYLQFTGATAKITYVLFDEVNGTINIVAPDQVSMVTSVESVGNWWRFIVTGTDTGSNTNLNFGFYGTLSQNGTSLSPGIGSARTIWGAQANIGSTAKPYFPTTDRLNVPRLTYQNGGGGCPSLLLEKQSTNVVTYSEEFDNAAFTVATNNGTLTRTANYGTSPDGTQNADRLQMSITAATNNYSQLYQLLTVTNGQTYTWSVYIKSLSGTPTIGWAYDGSNWQNITVTTDWVRYTRTTTATSININADFLLYHNIGTSSSADILVWGYQIEASSYPTSYIPTTSSSATRVADACSKTGISSLIGQTEGVVFWDIEIEILSATGNENILNIDDGTGFGNTIYLFKASNGILFAVVYASGVGQCSLSYTLPSVGRYKMALAYKANDFAFYVNGVSRGTDSSGSVPTCSRVQLGNGALGPSDGKVNELVFFPTRLTNAELASLTTL